MARHVITRYVSDISGQDVEDGKGVSITLKFEDDPRRPWYQLDASEDEVKNLLEVAREIPRKGRVPAKNMKHA